MAKEGGRRCLFYELSIRSDVDVDVGVDVEVDVSRQRPKRTASEYFLSKAGQRLKQGEQGPRSPPGAAAGGIRSQSEGRFGMGVWIGESCTRADWLGGLA